MDTSRSTPPLETLGLKEISVAINAIVSELQRMHSELKAIRTAVESLKK